MDFISGVICRIIPITIVAYLISYIPVATTSSLAKIAIVITMTFVANIVLILSIGLSKDERLAVGRNIKILYEKYRRS